MSIVSMIALHISLCSFPSGGLQLPCTGLGGGHLAPSCFCGHCRNYWREDMIECRSFLRDIFDEVIPLKFYILIWQFCEKERMVGIAHSYKHTLFPSDPRIAARPGQQGACNLQWPEQVLASDHQLVPCRWHWLLYQVWMCWWSFFERSVTVI